MQQGDIVKKLTPMQRQYLELKKQYKDCILMFRLGDFYEMFNEDAKVASSDLDIVLTSRGEGVAKWPMCGVPHHAVQGYVAKLLAAGHTVAIADQVEDASQAKGLVKRDVVRVVTPGTVLETGMLEDATNNYLLAIIEHSDVVGLAAVDVSTGEFIATQFEGSYISEATLNEIGRIKPSEILLPEDASKNVALSSAYDEIGARRTYRNDLDFSSQSAEERLKEQFRVTTLDGYGLGDKDVALGAAGAVLAYLADVHKANATTLTGIWTYSVDTHMIVDSTTQRNLELIRNARDGSPRGTLLSVLSKTVTPMGKRKLKQWILQPLTNISAIDRRLNAVDEFARTAMTRTSVAASLRNLGDLERITSRIVFGVANARDLLALRIALEKLPNIRKTLGECKAELLKSSAESIDLLKDLTKTLKAAIVDEPPVSIRD
ncbi:MAG: DNA mismatch repair protein MutS, partial [Candidatus Thorarchaeota archaeon]